MILKSDTTAITILLNRTPEATLLGFLGQTFWLKHGATKPNSNYQRAVGMKDIWCHEILRVNSFSTEPTNKDSSLSTDGRTKKSEAEP